MHQGCRLDKVLIVDDELGIRRLVHHGLNAIEFELYEAPDGESALRLTATKCPSVVLLDLGLPDMDGVEVVRRIREWSCVPIIILSARDQERDKVEALEAGADDYLTKPFGVGELTARIRVALRHVSQAHSPAEPVFRFGEISFDLAAHIVKRGDEEIHLTRTEFSLLAILVRHADRVVTHRQLLTEVWGPEFTEESHYLRVYMGQLRQKTEADSAQPRYLITEMGVGYRLKSDESN